MANTLTNLIPDAYAALDVVSRELVGFIPAVARDSNADRVAVGANLDIPITPSNTSAADITAAMSLPSAADQTITPTRYTITKSRYTKFNWSGTEQRAVDTGPGFLTLQQDQIAQSMRALVNEMETDLANAIAIGASRAYGTAGTTPFATASDMSDFAQLNKILQDNGAPMSDLHLVLGTTASANIRGKQSQLFKVNEAGTSDLLRSGKIGSIMGYDTHESAQVNNQAAGTGTSYQTNHATYPVGTTSIDIDTGTGTIVAGDVVTFTGDTNKYIVATGFAGDGAGTIVIAAPGLRKTLADNVAMAISAISVRNVGMARNACLLGTRLPDVPREGDQATDRMTITDPRSNISFELAIYPGFRMNVYFIGASWGVKVIKPEHSAILLG